MDSKSNAMPVNTSVEGKDLLVRCKRTKFAVPIVEPQQDVYSIENKASASKDLMRIDSTVQSPVDDGCTVGHARGTFFTDNESARSRLPKICRAIGWGEPLYHFEEQGPAHNKIFKCKVTVHIVGVKNTLLECFSDPKKRKKAAQEHAAQGALWYIYNRERGQRSSYALPTELLSAALATALNRPLFRTSGCCLNMSLVCSD